MRANRRLRGLAIALGLTLVLVGLSQLSGTAGTLGSTNPCPSNWFPLSSQPYATQVACGQLRQQADLNELATAQARPYATSVPPTHNLALAGTPILAGYIPNEVKTIHQLNTCLVGRVHARPVTDCWLAGYVAGSTHRGYAGIVVYAVGTGRDVPRPTIIRYFYPIGDMPNPAFDYNTAWTAPRDIGDITMTGITGPNGVVSFTSKSGVTGTLNMANGTWKFNS